MASGSSNIAFNEWIVSATKPDADNKWWLSTLADGPNPSPLAEMAKRRKQRKQHRIGRGLGPPRPLLTMALDVLIENITDVSEEALAALPPRLLWRIWDHLVPVGVCFHTWKIFSRLLLDDRMGDPHVSVIPMGAYRFRHIIKDPRSELRIYTTPLRSPNLDFLVSLTIGNAAAIFQVTELLALADLPNLVVLEFATHEQTLRDFNSITDRLVRGWSEKDAPFPCLRILRVVGTSTVSRQALTYISCFPALLFFDISGWAHQWQNAKSIAHDFGWKLVRDHDTDLDERDRPGASFSQYMAARFGDACKPSEFCTRNLSWIYEMDKNTVRIGTVPLSADKEETEAYEKINGCAAVSDDQLEELWQMLTAPAVARPETRSFYKSAFTFWAHALIVGTRAHTPPPQTEGRVGVKHSADAPAVAADDIRQLSVGNVPLPSKPFAHLFLEGGHCGRLPTMSVGSKVQTYLFYRSPDLNSPSRSEDRSSLASQLTQKPPSGRGRATTKLNSRKRQKMGDLLSSFGVH